MAHFRATIQGQRGLVSRLGSKKSGIHATVNGWDEGIEVRARHQDGKDCFVVWLTGGSNGHVPSRQIWPPPSVSRAAPALLAALEGLFEHCVMIHSRWGEGSNEREADAAIAVARAAMQAAKGE